MGGHPGYLLADEEHIYSAEVKVVKEGQGRQSIVGRVLARVKL